MRARGGLLLVAVVVLIAGTAAAQTRSTLFPKEGCSSLSRTNPCGTRSLPSPIGDPTSGPLTEATRRGPLDRKDDPLGLDAKLPVMPKPSSPQTLPSQGKLKMP